MATASIHVGLNPEHQKLIDDLREEFRQLADRIELLARARAAEAEVERLKAVLAGWEQNQHEATADAYDEGYTDATEFRPHRNAAAILAAIEAEDTDD